MGLAKFNFWALPRVVLLIRNFAWQALGGRYLRAGASRMSSRRLLAAVAIASGTMDG